VKTRRLLLRFRFFLKKIGLPLFLGAMLARVQCIHAADSPAARSSSSEQKALAEKLAEACNSAEEDSLIDGADRNLLNGPGLRYALLDIAFQRTLEGKYLEAETIDRMIIHVGTRLHDPAMVAAGQTMAGGVLRESGDYSEGLALLRQAAVYYDKAHAGPSIEKMSVAQALGITYFYEGNFRRALASLEKALKIAKELHQREGIIPALNTMGEVFRAQGQPERALEFYQRARKEVGDDSKWNMAFIFNNIGTAYEAMGDTPRAIDFLNRARSVAEKVKFQPRIASALTELGNVHLRAGEIEAATRSFNQSIALSEQLHDRSNEGRARLGLANTARAQNNFGEALQQSGKAAEIYRALEEHDSVARAQTFSGQCLRSLGKDEDARIAFEEAIAEIEHVRGQLAGGAEEAESFLADRVQPYKQLVAIFVKENRNDDALAIAERASSRALLDILAKGKGEPAKGRSDAQRKRIRELEDHLAGANRRLIEELRTEHPAEKRLAGFRADLRDARSERENYDVELANENVSETKPPVPASLDEMVRLATTERVALLKFVVTTDDTFLFVLNGNNEHPALEVFPLNLPRNEIAKRASSFRSLIAERGLDWKTPARALYVSLLEKSEPAWKDAAHLVIIPDGPLWDLPFQTLPNANKRSLLEEHTISYAPSITFLNRLTAVRASRSTSDEAPRLFAVANPATQTAATNSGPQKVSIATGPPLMGDIWAPLPAAEKQVTELKKLYTDKNSMVLTGTKAREEVFKTKAADFDVVHFATHGVLNDRAPLYSYLLMSQENLAPGEDGLLEAWELMQMKLHARLAVLAACETARGKISEGEGVIGLSWALFAAGCPSAVVSQWKVDSASNTDLMLEFHRQFRNGATAADALRDASLALAKNPRYRHPFYWAPFVAIGD
jgi:CHAT domain-containing protein/Tfp pilus assembly protein PilF